MFESSGFKLFEIKGIPVSASFGFGFLMVFILVMQSLETGLAFALAIALSLLIHEFGHAIVSKYYDLNPSILLHGFGGLCFHDVADSDKKDFFIVVMGPIVEIFFGALAIGGMFLIPEATFAASSLMMFVKTFMTYFAIVSVVWGFANLLLPIWPLDGGTLFLLLMRRFTDARKAERITLNVSMAVAIPLAVVALYFRQYFILIILFFICMDNYQSITQNRPLIVRGNGKASQPKKAKKADDFVQSLYDEAQDAMTRESWREASRLCHQIRASSSQVPEKMMKDIWTILGLSTMEQGEYKEALNYLKRAPQTKEVEDATARCQSSIESN